MNCLYFHKVSKLKFKKLFYFWSPMFCFLKMSKFFAKVFLLPFFLVVVNIKYKYFFDVIQINIVFMYIIYRSFKVKPNECRNYIYFEHQDLLVSHQLVMMARLTPKLDQIGPKWDKCGIFKGQLHLVSPKSKCTEN